MKNRKNQIVVFLTFVLLLFVFTTEVAAKEKGMEAFMAQPSPEKDGYWDIGLKKIWGSGTSKNIFVKINGKTELRYLPGKQYSTMVLQRKVEIPSTSDLARLGRTPEEVVLDTFNADKYPVVLGEKNLNVLSTTGGWFDFFTFIVKLKGVENLDGSLIIKSDYKKDYSIIKSIKIATAIWLCFLFLIVVSYKKDKYLFITITSVLILFSATMLNKLINDSDNIVFYTFVGFAVTSVSSLYLSFWNMARKVVILLSIIYSIGYLVSVYHYTDLKHLLLTAALGVVSTVLSLLIFRKKKLATKKA